VETDFFQKWADVTQKKPLNNSGEQAYRLLQGNPDIAKLIIATLQKTGIEIACWKICWKVQQI